MINSHVQQSLIKGMVEEFKTDFIKDIMREIDFTTKEHYLVNVFIKVQHELHVHYFDFDLVKCFYMFSQMKVFDEGEQFQIRSNIEDLKEDETRKQLLNFFDNFKKAVIKNVIDDQAGADYIIQQVDYQLQEVYKQLSIFDL